MFLFKFTVLIGLTFSTARTHTLDLKIFITAPIKPISHSFFIIPLKFHPIKVCEPKDQLFY